MEQRRRRELALVVLGVVLHSLYMLSIFDIYFKSPIVSGMNPEPLGIKPPANRVVLFIGEFFSCLYLFISFKFLGESLQPIVPASNSSESPAFLAFMCLC